MLRTLRTKPIPLLKPQLQRTFLTLPGTETQSLKASRILPYNSSSLYTIIADVDSYSAFLPYCLDSKVSKWSSLDKEGKRWPAEGTLRIGWSGIEETFTSRLFCIPKSTVEALSGEATSSLPESELSHHSDTLNGPEIPNSIFKTLKTRWTIRPFHYKPPSGNPRTDKAEHEPRDQSEVHLEIEFSFSNPIYAALSKAAAPKVAGVMIEAFEVRARKLLDGPAAAVPGKDSL